MSPLKRIFRRGFGFSLIELMIVVAVIGIIAVIAIPSYSNYIERTQFNDGRSGLLQAAQFLERCYVTNMTYDDCDDVEGFPTASPENFYSIATDLDGSEYELTATGQRGRVGDADNRCRVIRLDQTGAINQGDCPH